MSRTIWQYWETRDHKPGFVDGLHQLAKRNSGCDVVLVTPETLSDYLPDHPAHLHEISELAHKADMIRTMLVARYGGMWLDSDAIVADDICDLFDHLADHDFVGFSDGGAFDRKVRVNCFASAAGGKVVTEWIARQHAKFPQVAYAWEEVGSDLVSPICAENADIVRLLPFEEISPIAWYDVRQFVETDVDNLNTGIPDKDLSYRIMMLSNEALKDTVPGLRKVSCQDIADGDVLLSHFLRRALKGQPVDKPTVFGQSGAWAAVTKGQSLEGAYDTHTSRAPRARRMARALKRRAKALLGPGKP